MSLSLFQVPLDFRREEPSSDGAAEGFLGLEEPPLVSLHKPSYGFDKGFSEFFTAYSVQDLAEICDLPDPDHTPVERRRELRVLGEQRDFDPERYIGDTMEPAEVEVVLGFEPHWVEELRRQAVGDESPGFEFSEEEKEVMRGLKSKRHLVDEPAVSLLTMLDLLFAYAYNHRTTMGDDTCESAWTIWKLSASLAWFEEFRNIDYAMHTAAKRSLCYPLYRNWRLCEAVLGDVVQILQCGRNTVLRCLLQMKHLFDHTEIKYLYSILYLNDYCVWIQRVSDTALQQCLAALQEVRLDKAQLGLPYDLDELIEECVAPGE